MKLLVLIIISLLLSSCSHFNQDKEKTDKISSINLFKSEPPKKWERRAYPMALTSGFLVLKNNCIYLSDKKNSENKLRIIHWPWNYSLKSSKSGIHIIDGENLEAGKIGSFVKLGGAGRSFKGLSSKLIQKYQVCNNKNVKSIWFSSSNFGHSKNRKTLQ